MTDNEWAAGFLGWQTDPDDGFVYWIHEGQGIEARFMANGYGELAFHQTIATKDNWRPDLDLNQFKLVLDKFEEWWHDPDATYRAPSQVEHVGRLAWSDPASALTKIRKAVESAT